MDGFIIVNKEKGMTSFDVIRALRKLLPTKKIGHTGTLDPLATGVLILCLGKATRLAEEIEAYTKIYEAEMEFGYRTDSYDSEGKIVEESLKKEVELKEFKETLKKYQGKIAQIPPMYSAIKVEGRRLYEFARKGIEIERQARNVEIFSLEILDFQKRKASIRTKVSKGTYIRSLVFDIGNDLGSFATMTALNRVKVGRHSLKNSYTISQIHDMINNCDFRFCTPVEDYFSFPKVDLETEKERSLFTNGNTLIRSLSEGKYRIYFQNSFLGLGKVREERLKGYKYF